MQASSARIKWALGVAAFMGTVPMLASAEPALWDSSSNALGMVLATGMLALCVLSLTLPASVLMLFGALVSREWRAAGLLAFGCLVFLGSAWGASSVASRRNERAKAEAQPVIAAVERFHADTGAYPARLEDLVPAYLAAVPRAPVGFLGATYHLRAEKEKFSVGFPSGFLSAWEYRSAARAWVWCD